MNKKKKQANPIDIHVGSRIRMQRNFVGLSQEKLGERLGITFQQIQKYEKGANRVGASRLQALADILGVQVNFFFEGLRHETEQSGFAEAPRVEYCSSHEANQLIRAFARIKDSKIRRQILDLAKALSEKNENDLQ